MIRLSLILALIIFVSGCGAITNFIVGATGNVFSDTINREVEKKINSDCKKN
jgi:uncharacterized protein YceK